MRVPETDPSIAEVNDFSGDNQRHAPAVRIGIFSLGCRQYILWGPPVPGAGASPEDSLTAILGKHHVPAQIVLL